MAEKVLTPKEFKEMEQAKEAASQIKKEVERTEETPGVKELGIKKTEVKNEDYIEMRCYIKYNLYYGQPRHLIVQALLESGWQMAEISRAFAEAEKPRGYSLKAKGQAPTGQKASLISKIEDDIPVPPPPQSR